MRLFVEIDGNLRSAIERTVESLVDLLDQLDESEPDADDDDEEPDQPPHLRGGNGR
jgi:hypothetical protein